MNAPHPIFIEIVAKYCTKLNPFSLLSFLIFSVRASRFQAPTNVLFLALAFLLGNMGNLLASEKQISVWSGSYRCAQGVTGVVIKLYLDTDNSGTARFKFGGGRKPRGEFEASVKVDITSRKLTLNPRRWIKQPAGYHMIGLSGRFNRAFTRFSGKIKNPKCGRITLRIRKGMSINAGTLPNAKLQHPRSSIKKTASKLKNTVKTKFSGDPLPVDAFGTWTGTYKCLYEQVNLNVTLNIEKVQNVPSARLDYIKNGRSYALAFNMEYKAKSRRLLLKPGRWIKGGGKFQTVKGYFLPSWKVFSGYASGSCLHLRLDSPSQYKLKLAQKIYELPKQGRAPMLIDASGTLSADKVRDINANLKTNGGYQLYVRIVDNLNGIGIHSRARKMLRRMRKVGEPYENAIIISISTPIKRYYVEWDGVPLLPKEVTKQFEKSVFRPFDEKISLDDTIRKAVKFFNNKFAPSSGPRRVNNNLAGVWNGVASCRKKTQEVKLTVKEMRPGLYSATLKAFGTFDFKILKIGSQKYRAIYKKKTIQKKVVLHSGRGTPPVLELDVRGGCYGAYFIRHEPIEGLAGQYIKEESSKWQKDFCSNTIVPWLEEGRKIRDAALHMKENLYPHLQSYEHETAGVKSLFEDDVFKKYFGIQVEQMKQSQFKRLIDQMRGCAMLRGTTYSSNIGNEKILFYERSLLQAKHKIHSRTFDGRIIKSVPSLAELELNLKNKPLKVSLNALLSDALNPDATQAEIEATLSKAAPQLDKAPPKETLKALDKIANRIKGIKTANHQGRINKRRLRNKSYLEVAQIPFSKIDTKFHSLLRSLANGDPVQLDDATRLILGGIGTELNTQCSLDLSGRDKSTLFIFLKSSAERAVGGSNFGSTNFGQAWKDMASGQVLFNAGIAIGRAFSCSKPAVDGLIQLIVDAVQSNTHSADGGEPLFIRTCAQHLSGSQCQCLVKVGSSVIPNIHQERYSRGLVGQIIRGNVFAGMQLIGLCGISRY